MEAATAQGLAEAQFGNALLGDQRRTRRLVGVLPNSSRGQNSLGWLGLRLCEAPASSASDAAASRTLPQPPKDRFGQLAHLTTGRGRPALLAG